MQQKVIFSTVCLPLADREAQVADRLLLVVILVDGLLVVDGLHLVDVLFLLDRLPLMVVWEVGRAVHHCSYAQSGQ